VALPPSIHAAVSAFAAAVRARYGARVRALTVFGSHARGEATPESDVDVAIVIDDMTSSEGREVAYLAGDILTEHGVLISAFAISTARMDELRARDRLIARDIAREGIPV
jgi:uncharacterized protein